MGLTPSDYYNLTSDLMEASRGAAMQAAGLGARGGVVSVLEGGYDVSRDSEGLGACVEAHIRALSHMPPL